MAPWDNYAAISTFVTLSDIGPSNHSPNLLKFVAEERAKGYDAVCLPLTTQKWKDRWIYMCLSGSDRDTDMVAERLAEPWRSNPSFHPDEVTMTRLDEAEGVTVMVSDWLELDANDGWLRHDSEIALQQELAYASYLNVLAAILPPPRNRIHVASYARAVNSCLKNTPYIQLSIRLPIYDPSVLRPSSPSSSSAFIPSLLAVPETPPRRSSLRTSEPELNDTWEMWDTIRSICDYSPRLTLALDLTPPLPTTLGVLGRWASEPVRYIYLPSSTFIANSKGYPVLPKGTQSFLRDSMTHRPTVILAGTKLGLHNRGGEAVYSQYVRHLEQSSPAVLAAQQSGTVENFAQGYQDYLQAPLQPLMDNLQSITYQTFEQDPVKYRNYEEAMYHALVDWPQNDRIVFCIAGAGRGPLIARCLKAIDRSRRKAFIYAVEKNPNAFLTLQSRKEHEWGAKVTLLFGDMRSIEVPEKADILVSELLGSFGDNELSPECLDGAVRFLKPDGISIPSSYTAHLAPLSSSKLYNEAHTGKADKGVETPYVVMFQAINILSGEGGRNGRCGPQVQECWEFEHPRRDAVLNDQGLPITNSHNARSANLRFYIPHAGVLHGLAGYFEAVLYDTIGLSIHPHRKEHISKDMLSWFPMFFPFKEPLYLPSNSELQVSIWRLTDRRQVWYEWHAESFLAVPSAPLADAPSLSAAHAHLSFFAPSPVMTASPLIDAVETHERRELEGLQGEGPSVIKIGQTGLHNPGGRSSWIGL